MDLLNLKKTNSCFESLERISLNVLSSPKEFSLKVQKVAQKVFQIISFAFKSFEIKIRDFFNEKVKEITQFINQIYKYKEKLLSESDMNASDPSPSNVKINIDKTAEEGASPSEETDFSNLSLPLKITESDLNIGQGVVNNLELVIKEDESPSEVTDCFAIHTTPEIIELDLSSGQEFVNNLELTVRESKGEFKVDFLLPANEVKKVVILPIDVDNSSSKRARKVMIIGLIVLSGVALTYLYAHTPEIKEKYFTSYIYLEKDNVEDKKNESNLDFIINKLSVSLLTIYKMPKDHLFTSVGVVGIACFLCFPENFPAAI